MSVPKLRFKEFDGYWDIYKLGSLFTKRRDKGIANVPTYSVTLNNGIVNRADLDRDTVTNLSPEEHLLVKKDDLAYNMMRMWQGALGLAPTDGIVSPAYVVLKPNDKKSNSYFFEYYFKRNRQIHNFWAYSQGLTEDRLRLYFDDFKLIKINAPIKEEQTKIASFLSAVDEKISQLTQKHELLSQYKQGMMQKLFSQQIRFKADDGSEFGEWEKKTIGEIGEVITGKTPSINNPNAWNGDILFVTPTDMNGNKYQTTTIRTVANSHPKILPQNAIMFTCIASIGKMSLSVKPCITNQQINSVVVKKDQPEFIYYQLLNMVDYIKSTQANTTLPIINKTEFSKFILKIPQYAEQTKIANFLSAIDQKIEVVAQQIEQAKQWKKGLLQQMFV
jgi:type I restriction enzyme S subunit